MNDKIIALVVAFPLIAAVAFLPAFSGNDGLFAMASGIAFIGFVFLLRTTYGKK